MLKDTVFIKDLAATAITGRDAWNNPSLQPISISITMDTDFYQASVTDNLKYSLNYAVISRKVLEYTKENEHKNYKSLGNIAESLSKVVLDQKKNSELTAEVTVKSTKSEIRAASVEYTVKRSNYEKLSDPDVVNVNGLRLLTLIGVFTFERYKRQIVDVDLRLELSEKSDILIHKVVEDICTHVESSNFKTVEALVMSIGQVVFQNHEKDVDLVLAKATKLNAISYTDGVGVSSDMKADLFKDKKPIVFENTSNAMFNLPVTAEDIAEYRKAGDNLHTAFIAFGSNMGNQLLNVEDSLALLKKYGIKVVSTSSLYVSKPMYFKNQPDFYNGVIKVEFENKSPLELLKDLKEIEYKYLQRHKEFDNGPRPIDLDILLYDEISMNDEELTIPHKSLLERTFVLQPLCELVPPDFLHPVSAEPLHSHLKQLLASLPEESIQESSRLKQIIPIPGNSLVFDQLHYEHSTLIMAILNVTPDSFSDGGDHFNQDATYFELLAADFIDQGANILDIGGVSTRPGSGAPDEEEEIRRVVEAVKVIRRSKNPKVANSIISIDTYRAKVAEECIRAGANIINDISMGMADPDMFNVIAKYGCVYIMNHTRGTPETMSKLTKYQPNTNEDIVEYMVDPLQDHFETHNQPEINNLVNGISRELACQVGRAFEHGVRKWQIIIDPGVGFAKNMLQNIAIIGNTSLFKRYSMLNKTSPSSNYISFNGLALLLGTSRKKFLGTIVNEPNPKKRDLSSSSTIVAAVQQNADIVRVHDVKGAKQAALTADAIYRHIY